MLSRYFYTGFRRGTLTIDIPVGAAVNARGQLTINCVATALGITSPVRVAACPGINAGTGWATGTGKRMASGAHHVLYALYQKLGRAPFHRDRRLVRRSAIPAVA